MKQRQGHEKPITTFSTSYLQQETPLQNLNSACAIDTQITVDMEVNLLTLFHFYTKFVCFWSLSECLEEPIGSTIYGLFRCLLL